jgi:hypothetical protein
LNDKLLEITSSVSPSKQSKGGGDGGDGGDGGEGGEIKLKESQDALSNLAYYGSSSSDDDDIKKETIDSQIPSQKDNLSSYKDENANLKCTQNNNNDIMEGNPTTHKFKTKQCRYFLRNGTCKNGNQCTYIHDMTQHELYKANASVKREIQSKKDKAKNEARREVNLITTGRAQGDRTDLPATTGQTLLRRLLQNDIRRERSLCLQLLRYIVDCNFLQEQKGKTRNETIE